jgi:hypothetical protein
MGQIIESNNVSVNELNTDKIRKRLNVLSIVAFIIFTTTYSIDVGLTYVAYKSAQEHDPNIPYFFAEDNALLITHLEKGYSFFSLNSPVFIQYILIMLLFLICLKAQTPIRVIGHLLIIFLGVIHLIYAWNWTREFWFW